MATYDEIMAQARATQNTSGMSAEEMRRRQQLIERVAQHSPELAMDMAKGPYRMNAGSAAPSGRPPTGSTPAGHPSQADPYVDRSLPAARGSSTDLMQSPTIPPAGSGQRVQGPPTASGQYPVAGEPVTAFAPQQQTSVGNPRYDFPANATGQPVRETAQAPVIVNVNTGGYDQSGWYTPADQFSLTPEQQARREAIYNGPQGYFPLGKTYGNPSAMYNPDYPFSPSYQMPPQPELVQGGQANKGRQSMRPMGNGTTPPFRPGMYPSWGAPMTAQGIQDMVPEWQRALIGAPTQGAPLSPAAMLQAGQSIPLTIPAASPYRLR